MGQTNQRRKNRKKRSVGRIIARSVAVILLGIILFGVSYAAKLVAEGRNVMDVIYQPQTDKTKDSKINDSKPFSILLLGIDDDSERKLGSARTDSIILMTVNKSKKTIDMVSFPRDTYTQIYTKKYKEMDKINVAYTYGGDKGAVETVEKLIDVPIDYYCTIDFIAFQKAIDALGGVKVNVPFDINTGYASPENDGDTIVPKGKHTLNGDQALAFARVRKVDNDIERGKRQQELISASIKKALQFDSIGKYGKVMDSVKEHMWTDVAPDEMMTLAKDFTTTKYQINSYAFEWKAFDYYNEEYGVTSYVSIYSDSLDYISHKMRLALGLDESDKRDNKEYVFESSKEEDSPLTYPEYGAVDQQ